jgi:ribosome-binding protein aMBF1 (putative translation factor)
MLAVVKTPHIEISINGAGAKEALDWLARKFRVQIIAGNEEKVNIEDTDFYHEMEVNRSGNLLEAARLKAGLSQTQLAEAAGVRQTMVSEFENGRRRLTKNMAERFAKELKIKSVRLI